MLIIAEISDTVQFTKYVNEVVPLLGEYGGTYIVRSGATSILEGQWNSEEKLIISRWKSAEAALAFWNSSQYAKVRTLRVGCAKVRVKLLEGSDED